MLLVYITCSSREEAKKIAKHLLEKKLCGCVNIISEIESLFFWPPESQNIDEGKEVLMLAKTTRENYEALEQEVTKIHSYEVPCIFALPIEKMSKKYGEWIKQEMQSEK